MAKSSGGGGRRSFSQSIKPYGRMTGGGGTAAQRREFKSWKSNLSATGGSVTKRSMVKVAGTKYVKVDYKSGAGHSGTSWITPDGGMTSQNPRYW